MQKRKRMLSEVLNVEGLNVLLVSSLGWSQLKLRDLRHCFPTVHRS